MAYWNRESQFKVTLDSYLYHYRDSLDRIEIVLIDDTPPSGVAKALLENSGINHKYESVDRSGQEYRNPGVLYNRAVELASHNLLFLTNPENMHIGPVITHGMSMFETSSDPAESQYLVYGCRTLGRTCDNAEYMINNIDEFTNWQEVWGWYQHSRIYNRLLHFAAFIDRKLWDKIGGFDPIFDNGLGYEDNDLVEKVLASGVTVKTIDEPFVAHQRHDRSRHNPDGHLINQAVFIDKWGYTPREFQNG
jgi:hypothetical protein